MKGKNKGRKILKEQADEISTLDFESDDLI